MSVHVVCPLANPPGHWARFGRFSEFRNLLLVMIAIHIAAA